MVIVLILNIWTNPPLHFSPFYTDTFLRKVKRGEREVERYEYDGNYDNKGDLSRIGLNNSRIAMSVCGCKIVQCFDCMYDAVADSFFSVKGFERILGINACRG